MTARKAVRTLAADPVTGDWVGGVPPAAVDLAELAVESEPRIAVSIRRRVRGQDDPEVEDVAWPRGWPLPEQGSIVLGRRLSGWVSHTEFDVTSEQILIVLRSA